MQPHFLPCSESACRTASQWLRGSARMRTNQSGHRLRHQWAAGAAMHAILMALLGGVTIFVGHERMFVKAKASDSSKNWVPELPLNLRVCTGCKMQLTQRRSEAVANALRPMHRMHRMRCTAAHGAASARAAWKGRCRQMEQRSSWPGRRALNTRDGVR